jgi:uncharacterized membrane protein SpoIIM required for sporulation
MWRTFSGFFLSPPEKATHLADRQSAKFSLFRIYGHDIPMLLKEYRLPLVAVLITTLAAAALGMAFALQYRVPASLFPLHEISAKTFQDVQKIQLLPQINTSYIFFNNVRVIALGGIASLFSFGALTLFLTLINMGLVSFIITEIVLLGYNPWLFVSTFILPHGILEIPAILIGMTFALRIGAALVSPPPGLDVGQGVLLTAANFVKILIFLVVPLLLLAAYIEANITPQLVLWVYTAK